MPWTMVHGVMDRTVSPIKPTFMDLALQAAQEAASRGEVPVGAVLVYQGEAIAVGANETLTGSDPTAHAEIVALRAGAKKLGSARLIDCDLYVTLEPCAMCAGAISHARIRRLYYGASDPKGGGVAHGARVFSHPTCHHRPEIYEGIAEREASDLLRAFFAARRD